MTDEEQSMRHFLHGWIAAKLSENAKDLWWTLDSNPLRDAPVIRMKVSGKRWRVIVEPVRAHEEPKGEL